MIPQIIIGMVIWCLQMAIELCYIPVILLRFFKTPKKCPPIRDKLLLLSASEVAQRIRKKQVTSIAIVQAYINRINEVNPLINAVLENRFQEALLEAQKVDNFILESDLNGEELKDKYPLLGVPVTVKGSIAVAGMSHNSGRIDYQVKAKNDATCIKYVRDSGAIPLLLSNVPELCFNVQTKNKLIGATGNPYDSNRTPGGSSGGEASLIGCGASIIGIGSDIAGSVRLPAHYCGIWGHKPSPYAVSTEGHYPDCKDKDAWQKVFTLGPMARYVTDLKLLFSLMVEPNKKKLLELEQPVEIKKIKIYYVDDPKIFLTHSCDKNVLTAIEKVISHFNLVCDSKCTKIKIPLIERFVELSAAPLVLIQGVDTIFDNKKDGEWYELLKFFLGQSDHELMAILYYAFNSIAPRILSEHTKEIYASVQKVRNSFLKILGNDGVFVFPVSPSEAPYRGDTYRTAFDLFYLTIFNILGFPSTACPVTFSKNGLPIGIQVVAAPNLDRLTLGVAEEIEKTFGGWSFNEL